MANNNNDENYQYINQQTTYTFRTHDQYRSWTLDKRHRHTVHNQTLTLHTAHQSESKGKISMGFKRNITTKSTMDSGEMDQKQANYERISPLILGELIKSPTWYWRVGQMGELLHRLNQIFKAIVIIIMDIKRQNPLNQLTQYHKLSYKIAQISLLSGPILPRYHRIACGIGQLTKYQTKKLFWFQLQIPSLPFPIHSVSSVSIVDFVVMFLLNPIEIFPFDSDWCAVWSVRVWLCTVWWRRLSRVQDRYWSWVRNVYVVCWFIYW